MKHLTFIALSLLLLGACGSHEERQASSLKTAVQVNMDCKSGLRTGAPCEAASRQLEAKQHRDAQATFRHMVGK